MAEERRGQFVDNLGALARRYVEAVEQGDKFAHARGLQLAEAVLGASAARQRVLDTLAEPLRAIASELGDEARQVLTAAVERLRDEGRRAMLRRQLEVRFGELADELAQRVGSATAAQLDVWQDRVLTAESAGAVVHDDDPGSS